MPLPRDFNFAAHLFAVNAGRADKIAYVDDRGTMTYGALEDRSRRLAAGLLALGLQRDDRVLLLMLDCTAWPVSFLGCLHAGIVPVCVNTLLTADDYAYMLEHSQARAVLVSAALLPVLGHALERGRNAVRDIVVVAPEGALSERAHDFDAFLSRSTPAAEPAQTRADDPAFWLYSSGSTGKPKGTVHTHANPWWTGELYGKPVLGLTEDDVCFSAAKLYFAYGLGNGLTFPLSVGATVVLMAERPTPDAVFKRWTAADAHLRPTVFFGAPTGFAGMLASPSLPSKSAVSLRMCSSAGEALPSEIGQKFERHFSCQIIDGIGSTEMLHIFISASGEEIRPGSTGKVVPGYEARVVDEEGNEVPPGTIGHLAVRGPTGCRYLDNLERQRTYVRNGWNLPGDSYVMDADGYFWYQARTDDMIISSGHNISGPEIEGVLLDHPAVAECGVVGAPDEIRGQIVKAYIVPRAGFVPCQELVKELQDFVKAEIAPYKYPRAIEFVDALPRTETGKLQRFKLRERAG